MTYSYSVSETFTKTDAFYLASKVASDLKQMQLFYNEPSDQDIDSYIEELVILLANGYLKAIKYGFKKKNEWVFVVGYNVHTGNSSWVDDRSGRVPPRADRTGASWYSFLQYSDSWFGLDENQKARIRKSLPIKRTPGQEPSSGLRGWSVDKSYHRNRTSLERSVYIA